MGFEKLTHLLDQDPPILPVRPSTEQRATLKKWIDEDNKVRYYMLCSMSDELQRQHEDIGTTRQHEDIETARQMLAHLQKMFSEQSCAAKYQVLK